MNKLVEALVTTHKPSAQDDTDFAKIAAILKQIGDRFVQERVEGWTDTATGERHPPVSRQEAQRRWQVAEPDFRKHLISAAMNDPAFSSRVGIKHAGLYPASSDYSNDHGQEWETEWADYEREWANNNESRAGVIVNKLIT